MLLIIYHISYNNNIGAEGAKGLGEGLKELKNLQTMILKIE